MTKPDRITWINGDDGAFWSDDARFRVIAVTGGWLATEYDSAGAPCDEGYPFPTVHEAQKWCLAGTDEHTALPG